MLTQEGQVLPCCLLPDNSLGNIKDMSLNEFWNCENYKTRVFIRKYHDVLQIYYSIIMSYVQ